MLLKQSTAVNLTILMIGSTDHITGATGLTLTIYATKAAGTPAAITPTVTELDSTHVPGLYKLALTTGHTDTIGELQLHVTASGADPTDVSHQIIAVDLADATRFGLSALPNTAAGASGGLPLAADASGRVDVAKVSGTDQTARDLGASVLLSSGTGTGQISLSSGKVALTATEHTGITSDVWDATMSSHVTSGSTGASLNAAGSAGDPWATDIPGAYGAGTAGNIVGNQLPAIKAKTDNLPASPAATGDIPSAATIAAAVWATVIETGYTALNSTRLMLAALAGKVSGALTTTVTIRNPQDTKSRIVGTVDADGNRSAVSYDLS